MDDLPLGPRWALNRKAWLLGLATASKKEPAHLQGAAVTLQYPCSVMGNSWLPTRPWNYCSPKAVF